MSSIHAYIDQKSAYLSSDFGYNYAVKVFGEEFVDSLPKYKRGKRKGLIKGSISWTKCVRGGWVKHPVTYGVEHRVGKILAVGIDMREWRDIDSNFVAIKGLAHHVNSLIAKVNHSPVSEWSVFKDYDTEKHISTLSWAHVDLVIVPVYEATENGWSRWVEDRVITTKNN
tara:strand:- start:3178 stop:3687 length:510 start_codon:yes stop_codon:yes gene_type:complete